MTAAERWAAEHYATINRGDLEGAVRMVADDFRLADRRPMADDEVVGPQGYLGFLRSWDDLVPAFTIVDIRTVAVEGDVVAQTLAGVGHARETGGLIRTDYGVLFRVRGDAADRCEFHDPQDVDHLVARARELAA